MSFGKSKPISLSQIHNTNSLYTTFLTPKATLLPKTNLKRRFTYSSIFHKKHKKYK